ncbi:hypothetical protein D3C75_1357870 [compost metagenome]
MEPKRAYQGVPDRRLFWLQREIPLSSLQHNFRHIPEAVYPAAKDGAGQISADRHQPEY